MRKVKVFFDGTPLANKNISGIGKVLLETLNALDTEYYNSKYDLYIFIPVDEVKKLNKYKFKYIKTKKLVFPHKFTSLFARMRFSPPIDVTLGRGIYIFMNYRNWNLLFSKSITYIHDIAFKLYPEFIQPENLRYLERYIKLWLNRTDQVATVSKSSKKEIQYNLHLSNVEVVENAADSSMYPRSKEEIKKAKDKWQISGDYYMYLGNIEPRKNLANLVEAFRKYIIQSGSNDHLVLIGGDGWNNKEINKTIAKAMKSGVSIIRPNKYVPDDDIPALISGATAVLQLSWHEGFGLSALHSLACGTPVIASNIPALREATRSNSGSVIYVRPNIVKDIMNAIKNIKTKPHLNKPNKILTWQESVKSLEKIIDNL